MRIVVPILALLLGLVFAFAVYKKSSSQQSAPSVTPPAASATPSPTAAPPDVTGHVSPTATAPDAPATTAPATVAATATPATTTLGTLKPAPAKQAQLSTLGSLEPASEFQMELKLTGWGGGIYDIHLLDYYQRRGSLEQYVLQQQLQAQVNGATMRAYPFAARSIKVNDQWIDLSAVRWNLIGPGHYQLDLVDEQDRPVVRIDRRYVLPSGEFAYDVELHQQVQNLGDQPLRIVWEQNLQGQMPADDASYMGDIRMFMSGYLDPTYDPQRNIVFVKDAMVKRSDLVQKKATLWPTNDTPAQAELAWIASLNRYFVAVVHPLRSAPSPGQGPLPALQQDLPNISYQALGQFSGDSDHDGVAIMVTAASRPIDLAAGQSVDLSLGLYAGPRRSDILQNPPYDALQMDQVVRYEMGCTWCTFQFLAHGLLKFLKAIHALLRDWALAIIVLVLVVRAILHPITRRAQINMTKMQRQMAQLQPEIEKLKKKYGDDQQKMNQEVMQLYREKGMNVSGALGCLPMFLQMPIWIALYAMLYFAIELRHEPAFYGFFQTISNGKWSFLADLAAPDHFITFFAEPRMVSLFMIRFDYSALNILPLLLAVTYWFQQAMMSPPPTNEQMAQQQKMMKWMMLLFPFMLYSMPSGLTLYMLVSSWAGMLDTWVIKRHIKHQEAAGTLLEQPKAKKPPGRIGLWLEAKRRELEEKAKQAQRNPPPRRKR